LNVAIVLEQTGNAHCVRLQGPIDISSAEELKKVLADVLKAGEDIRLVWAEATYLDATAIQLLWAAEREAAGGRAKLIFADPVPEPIRLALRDAGFEDSLFAARAAQSAGELA
jgi:anti-anti-sigma factor